MQIKVKKNRTALRRNFRRNAGIASVVTTAVRNQAVVEAQLVTYASSGATSNPDFALSIADTIRSPMYKLSAMVPELVMTIRWHGR